MKDLQWNKKGRGCQNDQAQENGLGGGGPHIGDDNFKIGYGSREQLVNRADKAREINAERGVGYTLGEQ